jgi:hypothetical protein
MSKSWQTYGSRIIRRVIVYSVIFGVAFTIAHWDRSNCEVDILETYVKIEGWSTKKQ